MGQFRAAAGGGGDCLIKLFGKTIPVPDAGAGANPGDVDKDLQHRGSSTAEPKVQENVPQDSTGSPPQPEVVDVEEPSADKNLAADQQEEEQGDTANQKEKLKKPDKILPCPRCSSMDTKFCYYNNYNINQPRHFCKNCQRYWTAGGAMRNVPVGAGRRKSKSISAASHFLQRIRAALPGDPLCTPVNTNGTVLSFGSDVSTLDISEQMKHMKELNSVTQTENADAPSVGSCAEGWAKGEESNQMNSRERVAADRSANFAQHPCMNGATMWPFSCAPSPAYFASSIAIPFYPAAAAAYWGCMVPGAWNTPWQPQPHQHPQSQSQSSSSPSAPSPVSAMSSCFQPRKHPRDGDEERDPKGNDKVWVPKTIRIDDVDEVTRSSIWSLIGIKGDKAGTDDGRGCKLARVFDPKDDGRGCKLAKVFDPKDETNTTTQRVNNSPPFLKGNPAALSRSMTFQERS